MSRRSLYIAWAVLIVLSLGSTALSLTQVWALWPMAAGLGVLVLAWLKARIVLAQYLGLAASPFWRRGFEFALALLCVMLLGLYLLPSVL